MIQSDAKKIIFERLKTCPEFYLPTKKLWKELKALGHTLPDLASFNKELRQEKRLEFVKGVEFEDAVEDEEMEALGFYSGPRAKLKARKITKADFARILMKHVQNMEGNLEKALQAKPDDLPYDDEDKLEEILSASKEFKKDMGKVFKKRASKKTKN